MKRCSVDRIEEGIAVLLFDDGEEQRVDVSKFRFPLTEGLVLVEEEDGFAPDVKETDTRRKEAENLLEKILQKQKESGD